MSTPLMIFSWAEGLVEVPLADLAEDHRLESSELEEDGQVVEEQGGLDTDHGQPPRPDLRRLTHVHLNWQFLKSHFLVPHSATISSNFKKMRCSPWLPLVLDNTDKVLYLTGCHSLLRPWWWAARVTSFPFLFRNLNGTSCFEVHSGFSFTTDT